MDFYLLAKKSSAKNKVKFINSSNHNDKLALYMVYNFLLNIIKEDLKI